MVHYFWKWKWGNEESVIKSMTDEEAGCLIFWDRELETERCRAHPTRDPGNMAAVSVQHFLLSKGVWNVK